MKRTPRASHPRRPRSEPEEGDDTAAAMDQVETEEDIEAEVEAEAEGA